MTADAMHGLVARLAAWTGLDLERGTHAHVLGDLIRRRAAAAGMTVAAYASSVSAPSDAEAARLIDAVTVCHSWFFRDPAQLAIVERLIAERGDLDIWIAGCASGEEAYSIAMLAQACERAPYIIGTDINTQALGRARAGRYGPWSIKEVPAAYGDRFVARGDGTFEVLSRIRLAVELYRHNLIDPPPASRKAAGWDLILCRNVLMYFTPREAEATIRRLARALRPGGHLLLGASDILPEAPPPLRFVAIGGRYVLQRSTDPVPHVSRRAVTEPIWRSARIPAATRPLPAVAARRPAAAADDHRAVEEPLAAGMRALEDGEFALAVALLSEAMANDPLCPDAAALTGIACFLSGDASAALFELRRALALDPELWQAELYLAMAHERLGRTGAATAAYRRLRALLTRGAPPARAAGALAMLEAWRAEALAIAHHKGR